MSIAGPLTEKPKVSPVNDPRIRGLVFQVLLLAVLGFLLWEAATNAASNMRARGIPTNFDFWTRTAGFDVNQTLITYSATSTYGQAFLVGLLNTLLVAAIGVVFATIVGFTVGIARLSDNWIVARLATIYVETIRNVPLLLQLLFWYNAVLKPLPGPRESLSLPGFGLAMPGAVAIGALVIAAAALAFYRMANLRSGLSQALATIVAPLLMGAGVLVFVIGPQVLLGSGGNGLVVTAGSLGVFLNNRGLILPEPKFGSGFEWVVVALVAALVLAAGYWLWARREQARTGRQYPTLIIAAILVICLPLLAFLASGRPLGVDYATLRGFNYQGGIRVLPEFVALVLGLVLYTASFIAEIVRAGIQSVAKGQTEAASALGLRSAPTLKPRP